MVTGPKLSFDACKPLRESGPDSGAKRARQRDRAFFCRCMKALLQRVSQASVLCKDKKSQIGAGLLILLGVEKSDLEDASKIAAELALKCARLRIFDDGKGKMNLSVIDTGGEALVVSQFTLCADAKKGNRPSYTGAAPPEEAEKIYEMFCQKLEESLPGRVKRGFFQCEMQVSLINDGPVTVMLEK